MATSYALCRALLVIMQIRWYLIMQYGCAMLFNDSDFLWMVDECAIIMCVISEYACFSGSWQVGETKISAGGVSYACVNPTRYSPHASLACFRTRPTRSSPELTPATHTQDSGPTVSPGSSTRREHFSADTGSLRRLSMG